MKRLLLLLVISQISWLGYSQSQKLTLEDAVLKQRSSLGPKNMTQLRWVPGTGEYAYIDEVNDTYVMMRGDVKGRKLETVAKLDEIDAALEKLGFDPAKRFPSYKFLDENTLRFVHEKTVVTYDLETKTAKKINAFDASPFAVDLNDQHQVAYTVDQNLHISLPGEKDKAITKEENTGIRNGEPSHRYEFGINSGTFWAPDGEHLAYYRTDETMVTEYPIIDLTRKPAGNRMVRYPFAGEKSHHATLGVYNVKTGKTIFLDTGGDPEHYLTNITWSPDGKKIYIMELNRDQNELALNRYDATSGKKEATLFEEKHDKYIQPTHPLSFLPDNQDQFIFQSQRDGYNHLYLYNTKGELIRQLTKGENMIMGITGFGPKGKYVYAIASTYQGLGRHLVRTEISTGEMMTYTPELKGTHNVQLCDDGKYYLDHYNSTTVPNRITVRSLKDGSEVYQLFDAPNPLKDYNMPELKLFTIKAADKQTDLQCRMFTPPNMDPNTRYPVIVYVYNGPGVQLIQDSWMGRAPLWMSYAAQQGFVVFSLDGRGSANRGLEFENAIFRDVGTVEVADQLEGVKYLKSQSFVDSDRMAVHGWSYGGFMTTALMTKAPGTFKVGVGGGPVIDWSLYEIMYTERYMDTPEDNPEGYKNSNLLNFADQLKGKLLLIHGTDDDVVVWQHSLGYLEKTVEVGTQVDYYVYPNHPHNVRGRDRVHLMEKVLNYIEDNLSE